MIEYNSSNRESLIPLFEELRVVRTMVIPWLRMGIGVVLVDDIDNPTVALFKFSILNFVAGDHSSVEAQRLIREFPLMNILIVPNERWLELVKFEWGEELQVQHRTRMDASSLDLGYVKTLKQHLPIEYELKKIDLEILNMIDRKLLDNMNLVFKSYEEWMEQGIGFCVLHRGNVVSLAYSCFPFDRDFEIQVNTINDPRYQRKGLATIVSAALIEHGLENDLVPQWDAANPISVKLAQKLGYANPQSYEVYFRVSSKD